MKKLFYLALVCAFIFTGCSGESKVDTETSIEKLEIESKKEDLEKEKSKGEDNMSFEISDVEGVEFLQVRHATSLIHYGGKRILVDPLFLPKDAGDAIPLTPNKRNNPGIDILTPLEMLTDVDIIFNTHAHFDHFGPMAAQMLNKEIPLVSQPSDEKKLIDEMGFKNVKPIMNRETIDGIEFSRVFAQHGEGAILDMMGESSGFILKAEGEPNIYFTGDTIFNGEIEATLSSEKPEIVVVYAGAARFLNSTNITLSIMDIEKMMKVHPNALYVINHMDTINHCIEKREDVLEYFTDEKIQELGVKAMYVPDENELIQLK